MEAAGWVSAVARVIEVNDIGEGKLKKEIPTAIYFAVGAFTTTEREERSARLLKAGGKSKTTRHIEGEGPMVKYGPGVKIPVTLLAAIQAIAHSERPGKGGVSLHLEIFKPGWPGHDSKGQPRDAKVQFKKWLTSAEGNARFGSASAVTLYAVNFALDPT